jgi:hypothetical protein
MTATPPPRRLVPTPADVARTPRLYLPAGARYHDLAARTDCPHGYSLIDSCPTCDHDLDEAWRRGETAIDGRDLP